MKKRGSAAGEMHSRERHSRQATIRASAQMVAAFLSIVFGVSGAAPQLAKSAGQKSKSQAGLVAGRQLFATSCASCHGLDGRGGERAPNILVRPEVERMRDADLSRVIREGTPSQKMPAFGSSLDSAAIAEVIAYLRKLLQGTARPAPFPGDPVAGKALYFGKAGCADCHMINGSGGFFGADLSAYASSHNVSEIRGAITNPSENADGREKTVVVITREGERLTGIARNEDNFSLQLQTTDGTFHLLMKSEVERIDYLPQSLMPADYEQRLNAREIDDLVSFLMRSAAEASKSPARAAFRKGEDEHQ
jgi:cytochrome c oxidase cbb3-type subunit III